MVKKIRTLDKCPLLRFVDELSSVNLAQFLDGDLTGNRTPIAGMKTRFPNR